MSHNAAMLDVYEGALRRLRAGTFRATLQPRVPEPDGYEYEVLEEFYLEQIPRYKYLAALEADQ